MGVHRGWVRAPPGHPGVLETGGGQRAKGGHPNPTEGAAASPPPYKPAARQGCAPVGRGGGAGASRPLQ